MQHGVSRVQPSFIRREEGYASIDVESLRLPARPPINQDRLNRLLNLFDLTHPLSPRPSRRNLSTGFISTESEIPAKTYTSLVGGELCDLTGKRSILDVDDYSPLDVIFMRRSDWSSATKNAVFLLSEKQKHMPSIIFDEASSHNAVYYAIYRILSHAYRWRSDDINLIYPNQSFRDVSSGKVTILGENASGDSIVNALTSGAMLVYVHSHGDQLDVKLNRTSALCPVVSSMEWPTASNVFPTCYTNRQCTKFDVSLTAQSGEFLLLDPSRVSAGVSIFDTCLFSKIRNFSSPTAIDAFSVMHCRGTVGSLIADTEISPGSELITLRLAQHLAESSEIGTAIHDFNRSQADLGIGKRLFLFGDPGTLGATTQTSFSPLNFNDVYPLQPIEMTDKQIVIQRLRDNALLVNDRHYEVASRWKLSEIDAGLFFKRNVMLWSGALTILPVDRVTACYCCGGTLKTHLVGATISRSPSRYISICELCEVTADAPIGLIAEDPFEHIEKGTVRLKTNFQWTTAAFKVWTDPISKPKIKIFKKYDPLVEIKYLQFPDYRSRQVFVALIFSIDNDYATYAVKGAADNAGNIILPKAVHNTGQKIGSL